MSSSELRKKFLDFFKSRGHVVVRSSSLLPDDPSVLLTTAGMQQFKKYYTGEADPIRDFNSKNTASVQKCFRTSDIDEVGDNSHLTFFEMLGNFSFGGYFKREAVSFAYDFIVREIGLKIDCISIFDGEGDIPADTESEQIWKEVAPDVLIKKFGRADNFWGPTGDEGPCGPTTEIYVNGVEIWNIVFNEYYADPDGSLKKVKDPGVDTGMGLERLAAVSQQKNNIFGSDLFQPFIENLPTEIPERERRIIIDHLRGSTFLIADGVRPSNKEAGYILRRLLRRVLVYENIYKLSSYILDAILHDINHEFGDFYPELMRENMLIQKEFSEERRKFSQTLSRGVRELKKETNIDGVKAFRLYESFGLPYEIIKELAGSESNDLRREDFEAEFKKHQEISRAGVEKKFGGHGLLLDTGELKAKDAEELKKVTRLHTATHLLQASLRKVLGNSVKQMGSDITAERARFDFTFERKLTIQELKEIEDLVNKSVAEAWPVTMQEMDFEEAKNSGALYFFKQKYPARVKVYSVGSSAGWFSSELCGGPHVQNTSEIGKFAIIKEEAVAAGVRRIRAIVQ